MGRRPSGSSFEDVEQEPDLELEWPFGRIESLDRDELRETVYELFFTSCRSSPGFGGGRNTITYYPTSALSDGGEGPMAGGGGNGKGGTGLTVVTSRIKKGLGLRTRRPTLMRVMSQLASGGVQGVPSSPGRAKQRPMTSAEIMRQQMGVTEQSDNRLRKTLMRSLVGQAGRRAETIILPLELLRQLKQSEFNNAQEYHQWQRRQLKILEAGLLTHPSIPLDRLNSSALCLREVIRSSESKPIDTSKNSEAMRSLCHCVVALAWRSPNGTPTEVCHWADGYPLNVHLYLVLLHSIFDLRDESIVLDEVDELMELMKKTWTTLGINRMIHNVCFAWVLFEQYIVTGQVEQDLLCATLGMIAEVANDAKGTDREPGYQRVLSATLSSMQGWAEKRMMNYHEEFEKSTAGVMENVLSLSLTTMRILSEETSFTGCGPTMADRESGSPSNLSRNRVDQYIRSSTKNSFTKIYENGNGKIDSMVVEVDDDPAEVLIQLGRDTESLAVREKETFSPILKKWHPVPTAVAVVILHNCFGIVLKQYMVRISGMTNESVRVLQMSGKLEKLLVQMVVEDSADCEDGGKLIVREMIPYEVDSIILSLMKSWINERLRIGRECLNRAKETETWNPKSKSEPYAQSAVDLMKLVKATVDEFFEIPVAGRDELVQDLADGLETLFQDYTAFVAACGTKQSYIPPLPPLTRCSQESKLLKLWKSTATCQANPALKRVPSSSSSVAAAGEGRHPRAPTSRGTQRLYVRLNTVHYLLAVLHSIDKSLSPVSRRPSPSPPSRPRRIAPTRFDPARSALHAAALHVSEVAAHRLVFHDSAASLYDSLYLGGVSAGSRIRPAIRALRHRLAFLVAAVADRAQAVAVREVMRAAVEAFLMVLLAGGGGRGFARTDAAAAGEDLASLKRVFCAAGEGLVAEEVVEREAERAEGVVGLMGETTEKLVEEFTKAACGASGFGLGAKVPMPPTTGRWEKGDPNTVLRVLCHRNDEAASRFLKRTFQLPKRR